MRLQNRKTLIDLEYKPRLGAYSDAGYNSTLHRTPYKNFGFSFGVSLVIPIYDGKQKILKQSQLSILEKTRQNNKEYTLNQYRQQQALLKQQLKSIDLLVNKINKQIEYTHTLMVANGKLLETGDITMKDYVIAVSTYLSAQSLLSQNSISRLRILNQLAYWNR